MPGTAALANGIPIPASAAPALAPSSRRRRVIILMFLPAFVVVSPVAGVSLASSTHSRFTIYNKHTAEAVIHGMPFHGEALSQDGRSKGGGMADRAEARKRVPAATGWRGTEGGL
jgi:hypothetical protein